MKHKGVSFEVVGYTTAQEDGHGLYVEFEDEALPTEPLTAYTLSYTLHDVPLETMAIVCGYRDVVDMLVAVEDHIVRGTE